MITVNGVTLEVWPTTIAGLLDEMTIERRGIAVAVNGEIVSRSSWDETEIADQSHVEIVTAAAGG